MSVTVPQGMKGGMPLQVQTPGGLMQVTIPQGLGPGNSFEMMVPLGMEIIVSVGIETMPKFNCNELPT